TGNYSIIIHASSNIVGEFGSSMIADSSVSFRVDVDAPIFSFSANAVTDPTPNPVTFQITWYDDTGVNTNSIGDGDVIVTGPVGVNYSHVATLLSIDDASIGTPRTATYS